MEEWALGGAPCWSCLRHSKKQIRKPVETVCGCEHALEPIGLEIDLAARFCFGLEIAIDHLLSTSIFLLLHRMPSIVATF